VVTTESFQDWIMGHGWGTGTYVYNTASGPISIDMLTNPSPFGGAYVYEPDLASMAYNRFDLNAYNAVSAIASFYADINVEEDYDYLLFVINENGGVPNMYIEEYTGDFGGMYFMGEYDFTVILNKTISLGFYLETDYSNNRKGAGIAWFDMARLYHNTAACMYSDGTSMAAPHVTGVVAMCVQRYLNAHGSYSRAGNYSTMIDAVLGGASAYTSLNGKVASGRMLNAPGALAAVP
jgi:subtilisin family serine protease